jgi:hypothetical protein
MVEEELSGWETLVRVCITCPFPSAAVFTSFKANDACKAATEHSEICWLLVTVFHFSLIFSPYARNVRRNTPRPFSASSSRTHIREPSPASSHRRWEWVEIYLYSPYIPSWQLPVLTHGYAQLLPPTVYMITDTPGKTTEPVCCNRIQCNWQSKGQRMSSSVGCDQRPIFNLSELVTGAKRIWTDDVTSQQWIFDNDSKAIASPLRIVPFCATALPSCVRLDQQSNKHC